MEVCFNVQLARALTEKEARTLLWLLAETFDPLGIQGKPFLENATLEVRTNKYI